MPDSPAFTGLFRPAFFKSLLHKAHLTTNLGVPGEVRTSSPATVGPHNALFKSSKPEKDCIPCPQLFTDVIQNSWGQPASLTTPSSLDKKLYCSAPELDDLLTLPAVDQPVTSLSSASVISTDALDGLKAEDKRTEWAFRKAHQEAAWAIRTSTAMSFFSRAALIWLRQMQERLPPEDTRLQQDINKIFAATKYASDASLNSAKFASRTLASTVTARRLFWLCPWKADLKAKWKLAAAPYKAPDLFGEALEPVLVEDKDKRKVLPSSHRHQERRYSPYPLQQPFRTGAGPRGSFPHRSNYQGSNWAQDRQQFRDRGRNQQSKRPFRGAGSKATRRGK
ncbi:lamina-associated polypeptide 2-like [Pantherophis guttatus]|uniref:Lamina-associated polypeptide 2-like n=1 Tax=Pantherophis guttatus TaxID=94885 RepID=A0ABM3ZQX5_PANGU|nr:lamina-associated polypeptide 2-like [Pantherophis guttatus]